MVCLARFISLPLRVYFVRVLVLVSWMDSATILYLVVVMWRPLLLIYCLCFLPVNFCNAIFIYIPYDSLGCTERSYFIFI